MNRYAFCGCGHPVEQHDEQGCMAWVFGVPTAASAGRCSCSQLIMQEYDE